MARRAQELPLLLQVRDRICRLLVRQRLRGVQRVLRVLQGQFLGAENRAEWLSAEQQEGVQLNASDAEVDDELQQQLRELGYIN